MSETAFQYSNLSGRPPGPVVSALARVLPGVRAVQEHVEPYARAWEESNRRAVAAIGQGEPWWAVLGDSMSQGIGASAHDRGWVGQIRDHVGLQVVNFSYNGARVDDVADRQLPAMEQLAESTTAPTLVTLMVGNNDMNAKRWREALPTAFPALLERLPRGSVVATQPGDARGGGAINAAVDAAARRGDVRVAEYRDPRMRSWRGKLARDMFHPNDAGYAGMADIMAEALAR